MWKKELRDRMAYCEWLLSHDWQWSCSLPLSWHNVPGLASMKTGAVDITLFNKSEKLRKNTADYSTAEEYIKEWRLMGIKDHILIAYMGVFNPVPFPHAHLFLWSKRNRIGQTLNDLNRKGWESEWYRLTGCKAKITPIYSRGIVERYVADKNMKWEGCEFVIPYGNNRLLKKAMIRDPEILRSNKSLFNNLFEEKLKFM